MWITLPRQLDCLCRFTSWPRDVQVPDVVSGRYLQLYYLYISKLRCFLTTHSQTTNTATKCCMLTGMWLRKIEVRESYIYIYIFYIYILSGIYMFGRTRWGSRLRHCNPQWCHWIFRRHSGPGVDAASNRVPGIFPGRQSWPMCRDDNPAIFTSRLSGNMLVSKPWKL